MTENNRYHSQDMAFLFAQNDKKPTRQPEKLISKYVHGLRVMPPGSPIPGIYNIYTTPYVIEPLDNMSPYSPVTRTAVMKSVQSAFTTGGGENTIAYYVKERPTNIQYMTGTDALLKKFNSSRLDPLARSCGIRFFSQSTKKNNRATGDTAQYKEFPGGKLTLGSIQSATDMRQESVQIMIVDEPDAAPILMSSGEGNRIKVIEGRLTAYGERAKMLVYSTPTVDGDSIIQVEYNKGDKRKYFVECPLCGKRQFLTMGDEKSNYGLKGDYVAGKLAHGYYLCYHCHDAIFEGSKMKMLAGGIWLPTVDSPMKKNYRSYHLPAFYSPPGMLSWTKLRAEYDEAIEEGDEGMISFKNLYLAKPHKPSGQKPKLQHVIEIRSTYKSGEVPRQIMYLTAAADIQRGIKKYWDMKTSEIIDEVEKIKKQDPEDPRLRRIPRIEFEVVGHGRDFRTASITYQVFYGRVDDANAGAFASLAAWIAETGLKFKRKDGFTFGTQVVFIDSGYNADTVYSFCDGRGMTYASKGDQTRKEDKLKLTEIDAPAAAGRVQRFKLTKSGAHSVVLISTNYYKGAIYRQLNKPVTSNELEQPKDSHRTPTDYTDQYFKGLTAEEQQTDGTFHNRAGRSNEPLDLLVYNKAAADFLIEGFVEADRELIRQRYKKAGKNVSIEKLREMVNRKTVTDRLESDLRKIGW